MNIDETSECIYLNVQALNSSQTNSNSIQASINQATNPIVQDLSQYNVYLQSLTVQTSELPFTNMRRYVQWDANNFTNNKTNMSISFKANTATNYPFVIPAPNEIVQGFNVNPGNPNEYNGITVFIQYTSENSTLLNPTDAGFTSSANYPRSYWNVHSINQWLSFVNTSINVAMESAGLQEDIMYFYYIPETQLYALIMPDPIRTAYTFYVNAFLERYLDAFRWKFLQNSDVTTVGYTGCDYQFVIANYPFNKNADDDWTWTAEYSTVSSLCDTHSVLIRSDQGSFSTLRQQIVPVSVYNTQQNINLPTVSALKNIDIDFSTLNFSTINNTYIQYESQGLFFPVNGLTNQELNNIRLQVYIMTIDNEMYPLNIPAGGFANIKFILKKKK